MACAVTEGDQPAGVAASIEPWRKSWKDGDLGAAQVRRPRARRCKLRTSQRSALAKALESLAQRRVGETERRAQLRLRVAETEQEEGGVQRRRQRRRRQYVASAPLIGVCRIEVEDAQKLTGAAARCTAGNERAVSTCGGIRRAREPVAVESDPTVQGRDDDVVRQVLGFIAHTSMPS